MTAHGRAGARETQKGLKYLKPPSKTAFKKKPAANLEQKRMNRSGDRAEYTKAQKNDQLN